ncbi:MAG: SusC/RagA family TonB-linked outer membrane protein [Chitinophagales bacterium]
MQREKLLFLWLATILGLSLNAQRTITGKVISSNDNDGISGATVLVEGTNIGARTNNEGVFKLTIPEKMNGSLKLKASFLGFKSSYQTLALGATSVDFILSEDKMKLDEVVVTAIGIKKEKKSLGYSSQEVKSEEITRAAQGDVFKGLDGKVAGLQITQSSGVAGAGVNMRLRGPTSLRGSNQPLLVVDGIIIDNSQNIGGNPDDGDNTLLGSNGSTSASNRGVDINPEDIESVNVLKGASASALYGSQAANGAIIITTKKGRSRSEAKKGIDIVYSSSYSLDNVNKFYDLQNKFSQGSGGKYADPATSGGFAGGTSWGALIDTLRYWKDPSYTYSIHGRIVGQSNPNGTEKVTPFDNQRNFFEQGFTTDHSIALNGGTTKNPFRFSISDRYQKGYMPNNFHNRFNMGFGATNEFSDKFNISYSLNYTNSRENQLQQGINTSGIMLALLRSPVTFDNANGAENPNLIENRAYELANGRQRTFRAGGGYNNPYWSANNDFSKTNVDRIIGSITANYDLNSFITLTGRFGGDVYSQRNHQYIEINSRAQTTGSNRIINVNSKVITADVFLTMPFKLKNNWNSSFIIGANVYDNSSNQQYNEGNGLYQQHFYNMNNASSFITKENYTDQRKQSVYGVAKFDYLNKIYLEGTIRIDRTSTLNPEFNTYVYPSLNASYIFSEDMTNKGIISFGKVRGTFAMVGRDADPYVTKNYFTPATMDDPWSGNGIQFPFGATQAYQSRNVAGNPNLQNEFTYNYEIGTDIRFFDNRLGIDVSLYYNKSTNQIIPVEISSGTGYAASVLNAGSLQNLGMEVMLNATPVKTKHFKWDAFINWSLYRNKVLDLYPGINTLSIHGFSGTTINHIIGQPWGVIYTSEFLRDESGRMIINDDKTSDEYGKPIVDPNLKVMGNPNPNFIMGIGNTFTYKNWSLSTLLSWKNGGEMWNGTKGTLNTFGVSKETENRGSSTIFSGVAGHTDADGKVFHYDAAGNEVAGAGGTNSVQTILDESWYSGNGGGFGGAVGQFVEKTDFLKLRELCLSYNFNTDKLKIFKGLELGLFVRNILLWTPYSGVDPEQSLTGNSNIQGLDYYTMPGMRSIGLKARVAF